MITVRRSLLMIALASATAAAQPAPEPAPQPAPTPVPVSPDQPTAPTTPPAQPQPVPYYPVYNNPAPPPEDPEAAKQPKRGSFDAGGRVRFPNGPDENGVYETYNWVAVDLVGRYFLLDAITVNGHVPIAIVKPERALVGDQIRGPGRIGGLALRFDLKIPKGLMASMPGKYAKGSEVGLTVTGAYMHEGALLLSERDFPLFVDGFHPGLVVGLVTKVKLGSIVDFNLLPVWTTQMGETESRQGIQVPMDLTIKLGSLVKLALEVGVFTGDDYSGRGRNGGRIPLGASLDVKLGPIIAHVGAGWATLITGPLYPTVSDSVYFDLNVKFAK